MKKTADHLGAFGWAVASLENTSSLQKAKALLLAALKSRFGDHLSLETYHKLDFSDEQHIENQTAFSDLFHTHRLGPAIIRENMHLFAPLIGTNMLVQKNPYLRIARPQKTQDNIGYHRDTFYGGSPYELSCVVPFLDLECGGFLSVMDRSHTLPESHFPTVCEDSSVVQKGSQKHKLGFLYAPKKMENEIEAKMRPLPIQFGQVLLFFLSTVHGSTVNTSGQTRWSSDIRVMNSLAPVDLSARPDYYETLSETVVTQKAKEYQLENLGV